MTPCADYQEHPEFKAFETLDDDVRQEKSQLPLELLKFIVQSGFDVVRYVCVYGDIQGVSLQYMCSRRGG